jgi:hypothetical protein
VLKRIKGLPGDTIKVTFYSPSKVGRTEAEEEADEVRDSHPKALAFSKVSLSILSLTHPQLGDDKGAGRPRVG